MLGYRNGLRRKATAIPNTDRLDFSKYQSINKEDPLVKIETTDNILIEPCGRSRTTGKANGTEITLPDHPEYNGVYVRSELASRLRTAAESVDGKYRLVVRAGHRPIEVQRRILVDCADDYRKDHPEVSDEAALDHARDFVSDPDVTLPPHVCGAAVDVEVLDAATGQLLDFGTKINDDTEKSAIYYPDLTDEQKSNRLMLTTAMLDAGLASCKPEWWHFSYGDQIWRGSTAKKIACIARSISSRARYLASF